MSRLTTRGRKQIKASNFVFPKGTKASKGEPKFPIHDRAHARSALSRAGQKRTKLTRPERCKVVAAVCKKFPTMGICETGKVSAKSALKRAGCAELARGPKKAKKKAAPRKNKDGAIVGRWKTDPRGGVSRTIKSKSGDITHQWSPFGPGPRKKFHLYIFAPSKNSRDGLSLMAHSLEDAKRQTEEHCRRYKRKCDLSKVKKATKKEVASYAEGYWD